MATLFRCVHGHLWEDLLDSPSLVEGEVRCPVCGRASYLCSPNGKDASSKTQKQPAVATPLATPLRPKSTDPAGPGPTRVMPNAGAIPPDTQTPPPSGVGSLAEWREPPKPDSPPGQAATVIRPALVNQPACPSAPDIEIPPSADIDATSDEIVPVNPFNPSRRMPRSGSRTQQVEAVPSQEVTRGAPNIPGYEILSELGRGGMGVVYKARQKGLNRLVALKMILAGSAADERDRARFNSEAEAIARLQHPNIVQIFEVGDHNGNAWFSLEFVDGGSLADRLKGQPLPVTESAKLVETLARAMHFAHQHGVVHRDLKPANVLLHTKGASDTAEVSGPSLAVNSRKPVVISGSNSAVTAVTELVPKITDFGLAKTLDADIHHTRSGMVVGTPGYMAPEQATGGDGVGPPTDTYALGVLLYQLVTGKLPFTGETPMEVMIKVTQEEPPRPTKYQPKLARDLETVILKCLEKDARRRYASALDLAEDLRRFLAHEPILARPVPAMERAVRWVRRRPAMAGLTAAVLLTALGLVATVGVFAQGERSRQARERKEYELALTRAGQYQNTGNWAMVQATLLEPASRIRGEAGLPELADAITGLLAQANGILAAQKSLKQFRDQRDEALFHAVMAAGAASEKSLPKLKEKVVDALKTVQANEGTLPLADDYYSDDERKEIKAACFELWLVRADATAQPLKDEDPEKKRVKALAALEMLETAGKFGTTTQAFLLRKARFLTQAGEPVRAALVREEADRLPPQTSNDHYLVGNERYRVGLVREAEDAYLTALRLKPDNFWARFSLALCQVRQGQLIAARDNLTSCLANNEETRIYLLRGFVLGQLEEFAAAGADFDRAEKDLAAVEEKEATELKYALYNNRAVTYLGLARQEEEKKKAAAAAAVPAIEKQVAVYYGRATDDLQKAIKLVGDQYQAYVTLAQVYRQQGRRKAAVAELDQGIKLAEAQFQQKALDEGTLRILKTLRFRLNVERDDSRSALADLDALVNLKGLDRPAQARVLRDRGNLLYRGGKLPEARAAYQKAIDLNPADPTLYRWLGEIHLQLQDYDKAIRAFDEYNTHVKGPPDVNVSRGRAVALVQTGRHAEAVADFTRALGELKDDPELLLHRGQAFLATKAVELAATDFQASLTQIDARLKVEEAEEKQAALRKLRPMVYQGQALVHLQQGKLDKAASSAEEVVRHAGGGWQPLYDAACLVAQVAGQIEPNRAGDVAAIREARGMRAKYQTRALTLLQQALEAMDAGDRPKFWADKVSPKEALRPLKDTEPYLRLARQFGGAALREDGPQNKK